MRKKPSWNLSLDLRGHSAVMGLEAESSSPTQGRRRRSAISIASGLKPSKEKLQKLWAGTKSPNGKDGDVNDLGTVVCLADVQMGALDFREPPRLRGQDGSRSDDWVDEDNSETITQVASPTRPPPPPPRPAVRRPCSFSSSSPFPPSPHPPPLCPPPPIPELSQVGCEETDGEDCRPQSPILPTQPTMTYRRRAKKPIRSIGQLEPVGVNRTSSVSTIARQYRELVDYPDEATFDQVYAAEFSHGRRPSRRGAVRGLSGSRRRSRLAPSPVSDDGTLVRCEDEMAQDVAYGKPVGLAPLATPPATPPPAQREKDAEEVPAQASVRLQNGMELLVRELASTLESPIGGASQDSSGLQIWVMIEAYERLRDQIIAAEPQNDEAKKAIDTWLEALQTIHKKLAGEAAMSESEYEN
ncbi:hypothetical protein XA68_12181 [Ophiocordyceps unilateralis]|uniref:Mating-type switching protein swi10 n=1 Tax=Ophiocordyceps unilateralis TaxID=268505 RepID=A0A2A9PPE0_OPHUN|nr:hypothetical protein XA68_12181 [Ophiocordyceps unilateralis]